MIFISAGHHNADPGAVSNGRKEAVETKRIRDDVRTHLVKNKYRSVVDKDSETNLQYWGRIKPGSGSVILDIHFNAGPATATGVEVFVNKADFANKNSLSYKMADELSKVISSVLGIKNRGVKSEQVSQHKKLGILNRGAGISNLVEICFITNKEDMLAYDKNFSKMNEEIAKVLMKYEDLKD